MKFPESQEIYMGSTRGKSRKREQKRKRTLGKGVLRELNEGVSEVKR